ncbi:uncharacterized protein si:dkey-61p9.7 isoform X2 [Oncorhynchus mykiss]|uniref:Uncharacterized protein n=1 Tax=Oncorhynchus mykiss TaxID=8022 RepID=A0A8C7TEA8_ONCMY|nr:uncharacterized protein si:dkey-61p9.7 isoform X2 [Oncorhynchus mykiss]
MSYQHCPCLESTKKDLEGIKNQFETLIANIMLPCRWYEKKDTEIEKDREHKQSIAEMENFYKTELDKVRSDLEAERKKHDSFKQRMASELSPEIESRGDLSEDITNPCRETQLRKMYDQLQLVEWPKIKEAFNSSGYDPSNAERLVKDTFEVAWGDMERKKKDMKQLFSLDSTTQQSTKKVSEYMQAAVRNLQMALFYSQKADVVKDQLSSLRITDLQVKGIRNHIFAECYWLGSLMALHNPPLKPNWQCCDANRSVNFPPLIIPSEVEKFQWNFNN